MFTDGRLPSFKYLKNNVNPITTSEVLVTVVSIVSMIRKLLLILLLNKKILEIKLIDNMKAYIGPSVKKAVFRMIERP